MASTSNVKVSVLIPTFNRIQFLPIAINSILLQTYTNIELIVYDDGSTDNTKQYMKKISKKDARIKYIRCPVNKGVAVARNKLLEAATGDVICWQDSDDISNIHRIEYQLKYAFMHDMVFTRHQRFSKKDPKWRRTPTRLAGKKKPMASLMIVNKDLILYDLTRSYGGEDSNWMRRMRKKGKSKYVVDFVLYYIREHGDRIGIWRRRSVKSAWSKRMDKVVANARAKNKKNKKDKKDKNA